MPDISPAQRRATLRWPEIRGGQAAAWHHNDSRTNARPIDSGLVLPQNGRMPDVEYDTGRLELCIAATDSSDIPQTCC